MERQEHSAGFRVTMLLLTGVTPTERCKADRPTEVTLTEVTPTDRSNADPREAFRNIFAFVYFDCLME